MQKQEIRVLLIHSGFSLLCADSILAGANKLHDGNVRRAGKRAAAALNAVHYRILLHLIKHPCSGQPGKAGRIEEIGTCLQASATTDAGILFRPCRFRIGEG